MVVWPELAETLFPRPNRLDFVMDKHHLKPEASVMPQFPQTLGSDDASASTNVKYSCSIPLPSTHITRTESEAQLAVDIAAAEKRDERMFHRLINGIHARHQMKALTNKSSLRTPRVAPTSMKSEDQAGGSDVALDSFPNNSGYCPVTAIAKIVDTHHARLNDSQDRILNLVLQSSDDEGDEADSTLPLTEVQRQFQISHVANTFESTLSDNDWSISGFSSSQDRNQEVLSDNRPSGETEDVACTADDEEEEEEIFILDL